MIYAFIVDRCADLPVAVRRRKMKVSGSAFFAWRHAQANPTARMLADREPRRPGREDPRAELRHLRHSPGDRRAPARSGCA